MHRRDGGNALRSVGGCRLRPGSHRRSYRQKVIRSPPATISLPPQRHALAQVICTFKQGRIADRRQEAQQFRASGLNLAIAAIVH